MDRLDELFDSVIAEQQSTPTPQPTQKDDLDSLFDSVLETQKPQRFTEQVARPADMPQELNEIPGVGGMFSLAVPPETTRPSHAMGAAGIDTETSVPPEMRQIEGYTGDRDAQMSYYERELAKKFGQPVEVGIVQYDGEDWIAYRNPETGQTTLVNKPGMDWGDWNTWRSEVAPIMGGVGGGIVGGAVGALKGPTGAFIGGVAGDMVGSAVGRLGSIERGIAEGYLPEDHSLWEEPAIEALWALGGGLAIGALIKAYRIMTVGRGTTAASRRITASLEELEAAIEAVEKAGLDPKKMTPGQIIAFRGTEANDPKILAQGQDIMLAERDATKGPVARAALREKLDTNVLENRDGAINRTLTDDLGNEIPDVPKNEQDFRNLSTTVNREASPVIRGDFPTDSPSETSKKLNDFIEARSNWYSREKGNRWRHFEDDLARVDDTIGVPQNLIDEAIKWRNTFNTEFSDKLAGAKLAPLRKVEALVDLVTRREQLEAQARLATAERKVKIQEQIAKIDNDLVTKRAEYEAALKEIDAEIAKQATLPAAGSQSKNPLQYANDYDARLMELENNPATESAVRAGRQLGDAYPSSLDDMLWPSPQTKQEVDDFLNGTLTTQTTTDSLGMTTSTHSGTRFLLLEGPPGTGKTTIARLGGPNGGPMPELRNIEGGGLIKDEAIDKFIKELSASSRLSPTGDVVGFIDEVDIIMRHPQAWERIRKFLNDNTKIRIIFGTNNPQQVIGNLTQIGGSKSHKIVNMDFSRYSPEQIEAFALSYARENGLMNIPPADLARWAQSQPDFRTIKNQINEPTGLMPQVTTGRQAEEMTGLFGADVAPPAIIDIDQHIGNLPLSSERDARRLMGLINNNTSQPVFILEGRNQNALADIVEFVKNAHSADDIGDRHISRLSTENLNIIQRKLDDAPTYLSHEHGTGYLFIIDLMDASDVAALPNLKRILEQIALRQTGDKPKVLIVNRTGQPLEAAVYSRGLKIQASDRPLGLPTEGDPSFQRGASYSEISEGKHLTPEDRKARTMQEFDTEERNLRSQRNTLERNAGINDVPSELGDLRSRTDMTPSEATSIERGLSAISRDNVGTLKGVIAGNLRKAIRADIEEALRRIDPKLLEDKKALERFTRAGERAYGSKLAKELSGDNAHTVLDKPNKVQEIIDLSRTFADDPEYAKVVAILKDSLLDIYNNTVMRDILPDAALHNKFMDKYGRQAKTIFWDDNPFSADHIATRQAVRAKGIEREQISGNKGKGRKPHTPDKVLDRLMKADDAEFEYAIEAMRGEKGVFEEFERLFRAHLLEQIAPVDVARAGGDTGVAHRGLSVENIHKLLTSHRRKMELVLGEAYVKHLEHTLKAIRAFKHPAARPAPQVSDPTEELFGFAAEIALAAPTKLGWFRTFWRYKDKLPFMSGYLDRAWALAITDPTKIVHVRRFYEPNSSVHVYRAALANVFPELFDGEDDSINTTDR